MDKKAKAFAHFDAIKGALEAEKEVIDDLKAKIAAATDLTTVSAEIMDLESKHAQVHQKCLDAWTDYIIEEGIEGDAGEANRSGGEDKPPREDPAP